MASLNSCILELLYTCIYNSQLTPAIICLLNAGPYLTNNICEGIDLFIAKPFMFWLCIIIIPQP